MNTELSKVEVYERRLKRERVAREQAEKLLTEKSLDLYNALQESQNSQKKLELALWASQESYWEWHAEQDSFLLRSFSLTASKEVVWEGSPITLLSRVHEDDILNLEFHWAIAMQGGLDQIEMSFRFKLGKTYQWMRLRGRVLERDKSGQALYIVGTTKDITRQRHAEQSFHLMASAFSSSHEPMLVLSKSLSITECNDAFIALFKLSKKTECYGMSLPSILAEMPDISLSDATNSPLNFESVIVDSHSREIPVDVSLALFQDKLQKNAYVIATLRDISERKENEDRLQKLALNDDLTGLQNRNGLRQCLSHLLTIKSDFSLMFIDLDGFKQVNDVAGHKKGDECLINIASLLRDQFLPPAAITRWGGDEFVIALPDTHPNKAIEMSDALIKAIESYQFRSAGTELALSASIGVAHYPEHGETADTLLQNADAAMYQAKTFGKGQVIAYKKGLAESMKERVSMLSELRRAINHRRLDFYLQGKYDKNGYLRGAELLCRWHSALHGMVSPAVFIPLAEQNQLDGEIGFLALEAACDYLAVFEQRNESISLSINISANQLLDPTFAEDAEAMCRDNNVSPSQIEIELTESIFMRSEKKALSALNALRQAGFKLSLDDFGSGFSSLGYLRQFDFETIKLDRSLLKNIHQDSKALALFRGIVAMLNTLQLEVVVEGVESQEYLPLLHEENIGLLQGYFFEVPLSYETFMAKHFKLEAV